MNKRTLDSIMDDEILKKLSIPQRTEELYRISEREMDDEGTVTAPVVNLNGMIVFPRMISPVYFEDEKSLAAIANAQVESLTVFAVINMEDLEQKISQGTCIAIEMAVGRLIELEDSQKTALVQSRRRIICTQLIQVEPFPIIRGKVVDEKRTLTKRVTALMRSVKNLFKSCIDLNQSLPEEAYLYSLNIDEPGWLSDMISTTLTLSVEQRMKLLNTIDPISRLKSINKILADELDVLMLEDEIQAQVQTEVDRSQREFYLREQLKIIQSELGEGDIWSSELNAIKEKIEKAALPTDVEKQARRELERLQQMPQMAPEAGIIHTYLDWILDLPWQFETEDNLDISHVKKVLNTNHYGLEKVKDRILEYIAVKSLKPKRNKQPILCFVGPPGTGKTSLGKSIAEALGRKFVRVSLGSVKDEAEIRGHRRTYIGAMPGRILQTMRRAESINPLFMLDEIDKMGADFRGDPSAALLEVLDPEQNYSFSDHYLEVAYDLSNVLFITTANSLMSIPPALLDRMEVIEFQGYIEEEKIEIARQFLIPNQVIETGLDTEMITFQKPALEKIIREYTFEAGVRNLEREIGSVLRKIARLKSEGKKFPQSITQASISRYLGPAQFTTSEAESSDEIGVATGLAWTENGGEVMPVEVLILEGKGNLQITGQIGDVMQESAQAALSYIKSRSTQFKIDEDIFEEIDIHLHIPEGAIPKDGPSAGITIATAMVSAVTYMPVKHDLAMTGEITLRGRILPVGGLRDKILAAYRAGIKKVLIPKKNEKDLVEISKSVRNKLEIISVTHVDDLLDVAFVKKDVEPRKKKVKNNLDANPK